LAASVNAWRHFIEKLPGVIGLKDGHAFALGTTATLPTCEARREGEERLVRGTAGVATRRVICAKNAADAYAWWDAPLAVTVRKGTATWNPGSIPAGGRESTPVTVTGAATTDVAVCGFSTIGGTSDVLRCVAQVTAADTCEATLHNVSTATGQDLGSGTVTCVVMTT
jgi:hypothetical protein